MKQRVFLRKFEESDLAFVQRIRANEENFKLTLGNKYFINQLDHERWLQEKMNPELDHLYLVICLSETNETIGFISGNHIDLLNRRAEWGGIVLDEQYSGQGFGKMAAEQFLAYLFGEKGLQLIYGFVKVDNIASQKLAEKLYFQNTGFIPEFVYKEFTYYGVKIYSLTREVYLFNFGHHTKAEVFQ